MNEVEPFRKRLLLIGGGHAHLFVLEALRKQPAHLRAQIDVTLLSRELATPYSGMLPGLLAGHYRTKECHIDLVALAAAADVTLVQASVDRLDLSCNLAHAGDATWPFDLVSLDIGSQPPRDRIPGAADAGLAVKPIEPFLHAWRTLQEQIEAVPRPVHIVIVGGGAGGVEVLLAMAHRLQASAGKVKWSLVTRGALLPSYPRRAARLLAARLAAAGIALRTGSPIARVEAGRLFFEDGSEAAFDQILWANGAAPQAWPGSAGLACDTHGFILVNRKLQSLSHPQVFAAGDIATDESQLRAKAGVFAVRQGPLLAENLLRHASGRELLTYHAQKDYLSLLSTGGRHAVAAWYGIVWHGRWVWRWKSRIDRRFIQRFSAPFASISHIDRPTR